MTFMLLMLSTALAAGHDTFEVGGLWGTPTATDGTAPWWNPAGMAAEQGLRVEIEAAPSWGGNRYERSDGGVAQYKGAGVSPFIGAAWQPRRGPAFGVALAVPYATSGVEVEGRSVGAYALRQANMRSVFGVAAIAWAPTPRVSVGAMVARVSNNFSSIVDMDTIPDLHQNLNQMGQESPYSDADLENPDYAATVEMDQLTAVGTTGGLGLQVRFNDRLTLGASYVHTVQMQEQGDVRIHFGCPPAEDAIGRFGAESRGVCHTVVHARARNSARLPPRAQIGLAIRPNDQLRVEPMMGWVGWGVQEELTVQIYDADALNPELDPSIAESINQTNVRAKDQRDAPWAGIDVKAQVHPSLLVGGRGVYSASSVPDHALSPANYDANVFLLSGLVAWNRGPVELGLSFTHAVAGQRSTDDSAYGMSLDPEQRPAREYRQSHGNGTYTSNKERVGLALRLRI